MEDQDHYATLNLTQAASASDIKRAYRRLAKTAHPDKGGDPVRFQNIKRAYDVLRDEATRAQYDEEFSDETSSSLATHTVRVPVSALYKDSFHKIVHGTRVATTTEVCIPKGTTDYTRLCIRDDTCVLVRHMPMRGISVSGRDVQVRAAIPLIDALCTGRFEVTRPDGLLLTVSVPAARCIAPGSLWCVAGHGLPNPRGEAGSLFIETSIIFPVHLPVGGASAVYNALRPVNPPAQVRGIALPATLAEAPNVGAASRTDRSVVEEAFSQCPIQ